MRLDTIQDSHSYLKFFKIIDYLSDFIIFYILIFFIYRHTLFLPIPGMCVFHSILFLLGISAAHFITNYLIARKWDLNGLNVAYAVSMPFLIYTAISFFEFKRGLVIYTIAFSALLMLVMILFTTMSSINKKMSIMKKIKIKARLTYRRCERVVLLAAIFMLGCLLFNVDFVGGLLIPSIKAENTLVLKENEDMIKSNAKILAPLADEELWAGLSPQEKLDILQQVVNIQAYDMQYDSPVRIYASKLDANLLGYTNYNARTIQISIDHLAHDSARDCLNTVLHESLHIAQQSYVDFYNSLDDKQKNSYFIRNSIAAVYANESENYISGDKDAEKYYNQALERDARSYSQHATSHYITQIQTSLDDI